MFRHHSDEFMSRECGIMSSAVMPAQAGIQYSRGLSLEHCRLWNTGSPGQAGRRHRMRCLKVESGSAVAARAVRSLSPRLSAEALAKADAGTRRAKLAREGWGEGESQ